MPQNPLDHSEKVDSDSADNGTSPEALAATEAPANIAEHPSLDEPPAAVAGSSPEC